jgi:hypothetical protein
MPQRPSVAVQAVGALIEEEDRTVDAVLFFVDRVDTLQGAVQAHAGLTDGADSKQRAGEIATGIRGATGIEAIAMARRAERMTAGHCPSRPIAGRISVEMIVEQQRRPSAAAAQHADHIGTPRALGPQVDLESHAAQLVGDHVRRRFLPRRRFVGVKRVFRFGLAGRHKRAGQIEPSLFGDAVQHALLKRREPINFENVRHAHLLPFLYKRRASAVPLRAGPQCRLDIYANYLK